MVSTSEMPQYANVLFILFIFLVWNVLDRVKIILVIISFFQ